METKRVMVEIYNEKTDADKHLEAIEEDLNSQKKESIIKDTKKGEKILAELQQRYPNMNVKELLKFKKNKTCEEQDLYNMMQEGITFEVTNLPKLIEGFNNARDLAQKFIKILPLYYDTGKNWWLWNVMDSKWILVDETDLLNAVSGLSRANTINSKDKAEILEALKQESRLNKPWDIKPSWIQFRDEIVDVQTGEKFTASSKYFVTNPIPWDLGDSIETPNMDLIFEQWVGKEQIRHLYEILAYCMLPDYPIHRIFCLIGAGSNGKSCYLKLITKFIGQYNITSTELDTLLNSRFEITRVFKKLICMMGETNFNEINKTSIIKKLTGQDIIPFEMKGKNPFDGVNYAKIIIATNNLPTTTDKTPGFYRRWDIIDFPNYFTEAKDILLDIPDHEYNNLALKCTVILRELLITRQFSNEGSIEDRAKRYEEKSDPIEKFMQLYTREDLNADIKKWEFEKRLNEWCKENRFRQMSSESIGKKMKQKGYEDGRVNVEWWENDIKINKQVRAWLGVKWKS